MKIAATYDAKDRAYIIQVDEQQIVVPAPCMARFISSMQIAQFRKKSENMRKAKLLIQEAHHPTILPFSETAQKQPENKQKGRPKGSCTPKTRLKSQPPKPPKEPEPPPFRHTPFR